MSGPKVVAVSVGAGAGALPIVAALGLLTVLGLAIARYEGDAQDKTQQDLRAIRERREKALQELQAIKARRDAAQQELQAISARFEALTQNKQQTDHQDEALQELQAIRARFEALTRDMHQTSQFTALEGRLRAEIAFVQERREQEQKAQLEKRSQARLRQYLKEDILKQYMQTHLQEAIAQQRTHYADEQGVKVLTETQQALLQQMREISDDASDKAQGVAWEAALAAIPESVSRLERTMAALELLHPALAESFNARLAELHTHTHSLDQTAHGMARDTLYIELAEAVKTQKEIQQAIETLEDIAAQAELPPPVMDAIERAIMARDLPSLRRLHDQIDARLKAQEAETFARLRREALLQGLAELGYTAGENMETLLEKEGRIILRKDHLADYGIELASSASSPRMQMRVVSFSDREDIEADHEAERVWCLEARSLQEKARARGMDIVFEVTKEPGEVPVKKVARQHSETTRQNQLKQPLFKAK
jgi:hypothetical protein